MVAVQNARVVMVALDHLDGRALKCERSDDRARPDGWSRLKTRAWGCSRATIRVVADQNASVTKVARDHPDGRGSKFHGSVVGTLKASIADNTSSVQATTEL